MSTTTEKTSFKDRLLEQFEQQLPSLTGDASLRRNAAAYFSEKGFPSRKWEDYKYINPEAALRKEYSFRNKELMRSVTPEDVEKLRLVKEALVLVIVNGIFAPELSSVNEWKGVTICPISDAIVSDEVAKKHYAQYAKAESDPFIALNTALSEDGIFIRFAKNTSIETPIHLLHIADCETASFFQPRNLIVAENGAAGVIIESFESIGPVVSFTNSLTEVIVSPNAKLDHYRLQNEGEAAQQVNTVQASVAGGSLYNTYTFTLGGNFVRNNLNVVMAEKNGEAHLYGLYLLNGSQTVDNHTVVDHTVPSCMSNELYKGVVNGKSTAVFNGKIFVRPDAQKTNAFQTNRNILLNDDAVINTKPQLEIYADDVKCSHGTSTGRIDEEALFYLRARGVGEESARALLIRAFAEEVVDQVKIDELKNYIDKRIDDILK